MSHSTRTFLSFLLFYQLSLSLSLCYLLNRGEVRREGDTGASWGHPELHSGCGSHRRGDSECMHIHSAHDHRL